MFGFFKKKEEKTKLRKDESTDEEKSSTSKRDSLGKGKKLTLEMPKVPDSPGKKLRKEFASSEEQKGQLKSPDAKSKPPKSPESPGQRLKNKMLGSPLLRGRKEPKTQGISFDDISESSVTDSSRSDEPKNAFEMPLNKDDNTFCGNNSGSETGSKISEPNIVVFENPQIMADGNVPDAHLNVFQEKNKPRCSVIESEDCVKTLQKTVNGESNISMVEGVTVLKPEEIPTIYSAESAVKPTQAAASTIETPQPPVGTRISPVGAAPPSPTKPSFLSIDSIKVPMKKCTTPEISASVENLKKEYLMEMINKESALIDLQMKLNQSEVMVKEANAKITALEEEKQASMSRLHELGESLESTRHEAASFAEQLVKKSSQLSLLETSSHESARVVAELTARCRSLESQLQEKIQLITEIETSLNQEKEKSKKLEDFDKLEAELKERDAYDTEREEEIRMLQEALEEALEEKNELEQSINMNASRETQLLEDFEWKLHEIERDYKSKISDAEAKAEERVRQELLEERKTILDERKRVEDQLKDVLHLKSFEAEVVQLRGLVIEQQRAIRVAARQIEQLKNDERILQDHVKKLKKNDEHHSKRVMLDEESLKKRIEEAKQEIAGEWEDKFKRECQRLRVELDAIHQEEKNLAIESLRLQKDQELQDVKTGLESKQRELLARIAELQDKLVLKEHNFNRQIEVVKSHAERDVSDVRKQIEKTNLAHAEELEKLKNEHETELERLQEECDSRISANIEFAVREKLERTKRELEHAYDEKVEILTKQHQNQISALQNQIEEEKQDALTMLEEHYRGQLLMLQEHAQMLQKKVAESDAQWQAEMRRLRHIITTKEEEIKRIQEELQQNLEIIDSQSTENHIIKTSLETHRYELQQLKQLDEILKQENYKLKNDNIVLKQEMVTILDVLSRERQERYEEQQEILRSRERRETDVDWKSDDGLSSDSPPTGRGPGDGQSPSPTNNLSSKSCDNHVDIQVILEMQQVMADKEAELQRLTEEKRFYQLELIYWERNLANIRPGVPLSLEPYRSDSIRTYSAPPVTKPRLYEKVVSEAVSRVTSSGDLLDGNFDNFAQTVFSGSEGSDGGFTTPVEESYRGFSL